MSQQTLPCTPPELPRVGSFFSYRCLVFPKSVLKGKPVLFGVIQVKRLKKRGFSLYSLKSNFDKFRIIFHDIE